MCACTGKHRRSGKCTPKSADCKSVSRPVRQQSQEAYWAKIKPLFSLHDSTKKKRKKKKNPRRGGWVQDDRFSSCSPGANTLDDPVHSLNKSKRAAVCLTKCVPFTYCSCQQIWEDPSCRELAGFLSDARPISRLGRPLIYAYLHSNLRGI